MLTLDSPAFQELRRDFNEWLPEIVKGRDKFVLAHPTRADVPPAYWQPAARTIVALVAAKTACKPDDLTGPRRMAVHARPRSLAYLLVHDLCPHLTIGEIAHLFGGRDRTTITHGLAQARKALASSEAWKALYDEVKAEF